MTVRFWVVGKKTNLRKALNSTLSLSSSKHPIKLKKQKKLARQSGWSWVHSSWGGKGALKYRWNSHLRILECWTVTKAGNRPSQLIGEFVETLLDSQRGRVRNIHIEVS